MIDYLNQNQGAVIAALTLIYVMATLLLVWIALKQATLTQLSLTHFKEAEDRRYRPYVIFDIHCEETIAYAVLKNTSDSAALNVTIKIEPKLRWDAQEKTGPTFVENGVAFLAPGREISEPFSASKDFHEGYHRSGFIFSGQISYADTKGTIYKEPFRIDIAYTQTMSKIDEPKVASELKRIREALEKIASRDFNPLVRTIDEKEYPAHQKSQQLTQSDASLQMLMASALSAAGVPQEPAPPAGPAENKRSLAKVTAHPSVPCPGANN